MNFQEAFAMLTNGQHEGGYVNDPNDPGGETKYGISKRAYPDEDIKNLTLDRAGFLYLRDFWTPCMCDSLPDLLRYEVFDFAVNTSAPGHPVTAIRILQGVVTVKTDGVMGPDTLAAVAKMDPAVVLRHLQARRIHYYTEMDPAWWQRFGKGVMNRVADNMLGV